MFNPGVALARGDTGPPKLGWPWDAPTGQPQGGTASVAPRLALGGVAQGLPHGHAGGQPLSGGPKITHGGGPRVAFGWWPLGGPKANLGPPTKGWPQGHLWGLARGWLWVGGRWATPLQWPKGGPEWVAVGPPPGAAPRWPALGCPWPNPWGHHGAHPHRTAPRRTAPHRTALHRIASHCIACRRNPIL